MLLLPAPTKVVQKLMFNPMMTLEGFATKKEVFDVAMGLPLNYAENLRYITILKRGRGLHVIYNTLLSG